MLDRSTAVNLWWIDRPVRPRVANDRIGEGAEPNKARRMLQEGIRLADNPPVAVG